MKAGFALLIFTITISFAMALPVLAAGTDHSDFIQGPLSSGPEVTLKCLECHDDAAMDIMQTTHWGWSSPQQVNGNGVVNRGKKNAINNFCVFRSRSTPAGRFTIRRTII